MFRKMKTLFNITAILCLGLFIIIPTYIFAQDVSAPTVVQDTVSQNSKEPAVTESSERKPDMDFLHMKTVSPQEIQSLFFTYWQYQALKDAKNSRGVVRAPTPEELAAMEKGEDFKPEAGPREISLGGIVFANEKDWTIWLNGQRITPDAVPKEVLDLRVFKEHIELKWIDSHTNQLFPLRLRSHERFNLDMRIFLPG